MKKTTQPESMTFAGMEQAVKAQTAAAGEYTAEQLTQTMRQPLGDVSAKAGRIERDSPLFHGTGENPLLFGWDHPDAQPTVLLAPHHD